MFPIGFWREWSWEGYLLHRLYPDLTEPEDMPCPEAYPALPFILLKMDKIITKTPTKCLLLLESGKK